MTSEVCWSQLKSIHIMDIGTTSAVAEAIGQWISEQGLTPSGPMFNVNIVSPAQDPNPENWVTEVNYPIG